MMWILKQSRPRLCLCPYCVVCTFWVHSPLPRKHPSSSPGASGAHNGCHMWTGATVSIITSSWHMGRPMNMWFAAANSLTQRAITFNGVRRWDTLQRVAVAFFESPPGGEMTWPDGETPKLRLAVRLPSRCLRRHSLSSPNRLQSYAYRLPAIASNYEANSSESLDWLACATPSTFVAQPLLCCSIH